MLTNIVLSIVETGLKPVPTIRVFLFYFSIISISLLFNPYNSKTLSSISPSVFSNLKHPLTKRTDADAVGVVGLILFLFSVWHQARAANKRGEKVKFDFSIIPYDEKYRRSMTIYAGIIFIMIALIIYSGYRGYEETDSVAFCGETCHEVMEPQSVTYHNSPLENLQIQAYTGPCSGYISYGKTYTDADGYYELEHMPSGNIYMKACPTCTTGFE